MTTKPLQEQAEDIASYIKSIDHQDTIARDDMDRFMNTLTNAYWIHLVTCPQCAIITSFEPDDIETVHICWECNTAFTQNEAPDLFFQCNN